MELEKISYLVITIGLITTAYLLFIQDLSAAAPSQNYDTSFNRTYIKINEENLRINASVNSLFGSGVNSVFSFVPTIQGFFSTVSILLGSMGVLNQILNDIALQAGIPGYAIISIGAILMVGFIFAVYRFSMRSK